MAAVELDRMGMLSQKDECASLYPVPKMNEERVMGPGPIKLRWRRKLRSGVKKERV
jgi:hypothetical protein